MVIWSPTYLLGIYFRLISILDDASDYTASPFLLVKFLYFVDKHRLCWYPACGSDLLVGTFNPSASFKDIDAHVPETGRKTNLPTSCTLEIT